MRIFDRMNRTERPELTLVQVQGSKRYDVFSVLAKALLLFLLSYGSLGGFLSSFDLEYNNGLCMLVLFVLALILSAVYETGKRWFQNLVIIFYFAIYTYFAVSKYRLINSGYFAVLNRCYEVARQYLHVRDGIEYALAIDNTYVTVTMFALLLGMVAVILLNIMLQNKCSLLKVIALTFLPYLLPFYFDRSPKLIHMLFLLTGYLTAAILRAWGIREEMSRQMRCILPIAAVLTILAVRAVSIVLPEAQYNRLLPKSTLKQASEENAVLFAQFGLMALFPQNSSGAGVNGGQLSKTPVIMPTYETVLKVRYTPYDLNTVYLKAFTGKEYQGDKWTPAADDVPDNGAMQGSLLLRTIQYRLSTLILGDSYIQSELSEETLQGRGIMEVEKMGDSDMFEYRPYYTDPEETETEGRISRYVYYPPVSQADDIYDYVSDDYLDVPWICQYAVQKTCEEAGFSGTEEEIAQQIVSFFQENYAYTLRPGIYWGDPDYITHFLLESKRGYCEHFASAAVMLFRQMGIPARYAEGYAFTFQDVTEGGSLVEGADYSSYYSGYAPLGETALVEVEIPDAYAHAWVEIYLSGKGWLVVDPTPAQTTQANTTSFWEAFMGGAGADGTDMAGTDLGSYFENALGGMSYILPAAAVLFLLCLGILYLRRICREKKLPPRERVQLEYGRLQSCLNRRNEDFQRLRTLKEQLDWIRERHLFPFGPEQEDALYQIYFARDLNCDCETLRHQLRRIRLSLRYGFFRKSKLTSRL